MNIDTFADLGLNKYSQKRADYTISFILDHVKNIKDLNILDIGESSEIGQYIQNRLGVKFDNTTGDLDYLYTAPQKNYDIVLCLEVMEHLMSPKFFLLELKNYIKSDALVFITYPRRPKWNWSRYHFHEYDEPRFSYLINECGYKIFDWKIEKYPESFRNKYLLGVRPFIRSFFEHNNILVMGLK